MSGVATQPPPGGPPPGPHEPHATNGGPEAAETNGGDYKGPGQTNGPPAPGGRGPPSAATAAQTQKMLDENSSLINTISEYQKMGRHQETMSYQVRGNILITIKCILLPQWQLHRNLMTLAQMADSIQNLQSLLPPPGQVPSARPAPVRLLATAELR